MTTFPNFISQRLCFPAFIIALAVLSLSTNRGLAQTGDNAVCARTACSGTGGITPSPAFIDASVYGTSSTDLCSKITASLRIQSPFRV
jgi:hypothetical protein